jgi:ABC-type glutathione transport system ATPase component
MALILVSHDLGVIEQVCDDIVMMQHGEIVESGATASVFDAPTHRTRAC